MDIVYLIVLAALFAGTVGLVSLCERLRTPR
jgi:hypothetical protein